MNKDYVLIMKVKRLTLPQVANLLSASWKVVKKIAPGVRNVTGIDWKGDKS